MRNSCPLPTFKPFSFTIIHFALIAALSVSLILAAFPNQVFAQQGADPDTFEYTLESRPDDTPSQSINKAGLRLMSAFFQVQAICGKCAVQIKVKDSYEKSNGNSLSQVVKILSTLGGLAPEWKSATEKAVNDGVAKALADFSCQELSQQIQDGTWAIYKGRYEDDYKLVMGK
jgi:hypothetical protein